LTILTQQQKYRAVIAFQNAPFHSLTCGNDSTHRDLVPMYAHLLLSEDVYLFCLDCDYEQSYIPDVVFDSYDAVKRESKIKGLGELWN
jgi:hypothetical protein